MERKPLFPAIDRLSIITAIIMLMYVLSTSIELPTNQFSFQFLGVLFVFNLNPYIYIVFAISLMAVFGTFWLLEIDFQPFDWNKLQHLILPAMITWVIGIPLNQLDMNTEWWILFFFGGIILLATFLIEYIIQDFTHPLFPIASITAAAGSYAVLLYFAVSLKTLNLRLYSILPLLGSFLFLINLRTIYLRLGGTWNWLWAIVVTVSTGGFIIGFHYLPAHAISFGLFIAGISYALMSFAVKQIEGFTGFKLFRESVIMLIIFWSMGFIVQFTG